MRTTDGRGEPVYPMQRQVRCEEWTTIHFADGTETPARCQSVTDHVGRHSVHYREADASYRIHYWTVDTSEKRRSA